MKIFLILAVVFAIAVARPEPPRNRWSSPPASASQQNYGPPPTPSQQKYGPPPTAPQKSYGPPPEDIYGPPKQEYGPPAQQYGPPEPEKIITKNVYVHIPPLEDPEFIPAKQIEVPQSKKHYKIIFIKAPTAPTPTAPIIPVQEPDEHKTLVYVLVKKPEPQPEPIIATPSTTEPSKPEVFFIKYKQDKEKENQYGPY